MGRNRLWIGVLFCAAVLTCAHFIHYLNGDWLIRHDSKVGLTITHLFFDNLVRGILPLWIPEQNGGEPLWQVAETVLVFEPASLIVWPIAYLWKANSSIAYAWSCFLWLFIFALGGMFLSRRIVRDDWIQLFVFVFLFGGPLMLTMSSQSGFIFPFRYFPWVLLALISFFEKPSVKNSAILGMMGALSTSSFQSAYSLVFLVPFVVALATRHLKRSNLRSVASGLGLALLIALVWALPQLISCLGLFDLIAMPREYGEVHRFTLDYQDLLTGLLDFNFELPSWHGSSFVGFLPLLATALVFLKRGLKVPWLCWVALALFTVGSVLSMNLMGAYLFRYNTFLGLRNWGLLLPLLFLFWSLWIGFGLKVLKERTPFQKSSYFLAALLALYLAESFRSLNRETDPITKEASVSGSIPTVGQIGLSFPLHREWAIDDFFPYVPFQHQAAALQRYHAAFMEPLISDDRFLQMYRLTQQVRLVRYHRLVTSMVQDEVLKGVLGVTQPTVHLMGTAKPTSDLVSTIKALEKMTPKALERTALVEGPLKELNGGGRGEWQLISYSPNEAIFQVQSIGTNLFVWADSFTPDWFVEVDGIRKPLLIANGIQKAVEVESGMHEVRFRYFPFWYVCTFWVRASMLAAALSLTIFVLVTNKLTAVWGRFIAQLKAISFRKVSAT